MTKSKMGPARTLIKKHHPSGKELRTPSWQLEALAEAAATKTKRGTKMDKEDGKKGNEHEEDGGKRLMRNEERGKLCSAILMAQPKNNGE